MIWKCRLDGYKYYEYFNNQHQTAKHNPELRLPGCLRGRDGGWSRSAIMRENSEKRSEKWEVRDGTWHSPARSPWDRERQSDRRFNLIRVKEGKEGLAWLAWLVLRNKNDCSAPRSSTEDDLMKLKKNNISDWRTPERSRPSFKVNSGKTLPEFSQVLEHFSTGGAQFGEVCPQTCLVSTGLFSLLLVDVSLQTIYQSVNDLKPLQAWSFYCWGIRGRNLLQGHCCCNSLLWEKCTEIERRGNFFVSLSVSLVLTFSFSKDIVLFLFNSEKWWYLGHWTK